MRRDNLPEMNLRLAGEVKPKERKAGFYLATRDERSVRTSAGFGSASFDKYELLPFGPYVCSREEMDGYAQNWADVLGQEIYILESKGGAAESPGHETVEEMRELVFKIYEMLGGGGLVRVESIAERLGIPKWSVERLSFMPLKNGDFLLKILDGGEDFLGLSPKGQEHLKWFKADRKEGETGKKEGDGNAD